MATKSFNPFPKKTLKREPAQNLHPQVPQRDAESEEFINEYEVMVEIVEEETVKEKETEEPFSQASENSAADSK